MTSNLKGIEPPLPTGTPFFPFPPSWTSSKTSHQHPRSWPRQTSLLNHNAPARTVARDVLEPPHKRQKLESVAGIHLNDSAAGDSAGYNALEAAASSQHLLSVAQYEKQSQTQEQPLFPLRPGGRPTASTQQTRPLAIERAARRDVVPAKAYVPDPPACAPRYYQNGVYQTPSMEPTRATPCNQGPADFFPWTGHHPEDLLNEMTTRSGYYDKNQTPQSELNTARPSVWSSLKHKSGLHILSSLFVSALDQRQAHGTITANSTFKPPPRVTLTDTKREAWLRDLANPLIPLRRLSRTIPHGIRGKILLDHCLSKDIPISRAVWLAKCVGANEIRAFKRKGTGGVFTIGGETKWIKDWTTNIEQFLESIIAICGVLEWKEKIGYGLRLASHLYSEHLLDQDHYLDWLLESIEDSDLESIPIWLLVQQIHQQELLQHRQRGRRLASAILTQLYNANLPAKRESYNSVLGQLVQLLESILVAAPACFLMLDSWNLYQETIEDCMIDQDNEQLRVCIQNLSKRNDIMEDRSVRQDRLLKCSLGQRIIGLLDTLFIEAHFGKVAGACLRLTDDRDVLVRTCIEWSASFHRHGHFRTYAAARLLRIWNKHGVELQRPICDLLASNPNAEGLSKKDVFRLLAGLIISKSFSVGRYLQWLMARGTLKGHQRTGPDCPCDVGLLFEIPLHGLPSHVRNLRQTLIASEFESPSGEESQVIAALKTNIAQQLPGLLQPIDPLNSRHEYIGCSDYLSQSVRSDVARWIRQSLVSRLSTDINSNRCNNEDQHEEISGSRPCGYVTLAEFQVIRRVFEDFEDFAVFADVLNVLSDHVQGQTLAAVTDTVNHHFNIFNAVGAAGDIFRKLSHNVKLGNGQDVEEGFLESLVDLGCRLPGMDQETRRIRTELIAHAPKLPAAVCSPISDTMVEALQLTEPTFADEIDQMLASGTSIDKQNLSRVFATIVSHLEKAFDHSSHLVIRFSRLLARLRKFGPGLFDALFDNWLQNWLQTESHTHFSTSLAPIICSKVSSLGAVLESVIRVLETTEGNQSYKPKLALDALALVTAIITENTVIVDYRSYRLRDQLHDLVRTSPSCILTLASIAIDSRNSEDPSTRARATSLVQCSFVKDLAHRSLLQQSESASKGNLSRVEGPLNLAVQKVVGRMLHLDEPQDTDQAKIRDRLMNVLETASDLNISLAHLELKAILASSTTKAKGYGEILSELMIERTCNSAKGHVDLLAYLVSELSVDQAIPVREKAENEVLAWAAGSDRGTSTHSNGSISALMALVEASAFCVPTAKTWPLLDEMVEAVTKLTNSLPLSPLDNSQSIPDADDDPDRWSQRIDIMLRLLVVHRSGIQHPKSSQSLLFHLLMSLSLLLIHPLLASSSTLSSRIFDVLCLLCDSLPDDTRSRCIRNLRDRHQTRDPRLRFIFGYSDAVESEWLQLSIKIPSAAEARTEGAATIRFKPYPLRRWEMMQDATPVATENDTSLSLTLFGSRKTVL